MSIAWAPRRSAWMPIRFRSRQVKCMLMSSPVASRTRMAVGRTDIRTRPSEPSLMSTISTPRSLRSFAPCTSFSMLCPRGGSSSTVTRNSPASSLRCSRVGGALVARPEGSAVSTRARRHRLDPGGAALGHQPVERLAHRADVLGRRPAAAADQARAARDHPRRVVRHVDRRGEVHQPLAHPARQAGVRLDDHVEAARLRQHLLEDVEEHAGADRAVGADRLDRAAPAGRGRPRPRRAR